MSQADPEYPTALEVISQLNIDRNKYLDAVVLITGATAGIGVETARAFASLGSILYLTNRDETKAKQVQADIEASYPISKGKIHWIHLDLASLESVRKAAKQFLSQSKKLNILINNAGVMACPESRTVDGFETQMGSNHFGHFLLTQLLLPTLISSSSPGFRSRVISLTSAGHGTSPILFGDFDLKKRGYDRWVAYGQSKTANIYLATEIERRFGEKGVHALAVHPGGVRTELSRHMASATLTPDELELFGLPRDLEVSKIMDSLRSPAEGAATTVWAALNPEFETKGGFYLEKCSIAQPKKEGFTTIAGGGYAPYVYNTADATRLWEESLKLVGL